MEIEFDPLKNAVNIAKHGINLAAGARLFDDPRHLLLPSISPVDGEDRYKVIGLLAGKLHTAVHVRRGVAIRFVSVRRSNDGEERLYHRA